MLFARRRSVEATSELKQSIARALAKLSDRDTKHVGLKELRAIIHELSEQTMPLFLSMVYQPPSGATAFGRREALRLIGFAASCHAALLLPYLTKILASVAAHLKDADATVREACAEVMSLLTMHLGGLPAAHDDLLLRLVGPMFALLKEHKRDVQHGAAVCLARMLFNAGSMLGPHLARIESRIVAHLQASHCLSPAPLLNALSSIVEAVGGAVVPYLNRIMDVLTHYCRHADWTVRKASVEALDAYCVRVSGAMSMYREAVIRALDPCRFDKVKPVRQSALAALQRFEDIPASTEQQVLGASGVRSSLNGSRASLNAHDIVDHYAAPYDQEGQGDDDDDDGAAGDAAGLGHAGAARRSSSAPPRARPVARPFGAAQRAVQRPTLADAAGATTNAAPAPPPPPRHFRYRADVQTSSGDTSDDEGDNDSYGDTLEPQSSAPQRDDVDEPSDANDDDARPSLMHMVIDDEFHHDRVDHPTRELRQDWERRREAHRSSMQSAASSDERPQQPPWARAQHNGSAAGHTRDTDLVSQRDLDVVRSQLKRMQAQQTSLMDLVNDLTAQLTKALSGFDTRVAALEKGLQRVRDENVTTTRPTLEEALDSQRVAVGPWDQAVHLIAQRRFDSAFACVLKANDELNLVRLLARTGPIADQLEGSVLLQLTQRLCAFIRTANFLNHAMPWVRQMVNERRVPPAARSELMDSLQKLGRQSTSPFGEEAAALLALLVDGPA